MATTTPNYLWSVPTSSDLVKNGATAIETLGDSVDASLWNSGFGQAGKNKIINGDFGIWQRGTSFSAQGYLADRFRTQFNGSGATRTMNQQTFTAGTAPVSGYESTYFFRYNQSVAGTGGSYNTFEQYIEDVRTFAGQTATLSFWAKAASNVTITAQLSQYFGSGGSASVDVTAQNAALTTSWQRFTLSFSVPSISGKTIGTGSALRAYLNLPLNSTFTIDTWGWQLEYGSYATPFQTATGTIQGELAACQRYFIRFNPTSINDAPFGVGLFKTTTVAAHLLGLPVTMRTAPSTSFSAAGTFYAYGGAGAGSPSAIAGGANTTNVIEISATRGLTSVGLGSFLQALGTAAAYADASAEL